MRRLPRLLARVRWILLAPVLAFLALSTLSILWSFYPSATAVGLVANWLTVLSGVAFAVAFDWATLLRARLSAQASRDLLDDFALTGWRLTYTRTPNPVTVLSNKENGECEAFYSIGLTVGKNDLISSVQWEGPAFKAGLSAGAALLAVNGHVYKCPELTAAIGASTSKMTPVELIVRRENRVNVVKLMYDGGPRYPHLERIEGTPDRLTSAFSPR